MWGRQILQIAVNCCRAKSLGTLKGSASAVGVSSLSRFLRTVWRAKRGGSKWLLGVCVTGGYVAYRAVGGPAVSSCKQEPQRAPSPPEASSPEASPGNDQAFDWQLFFKFIGPDWFILLVAIGSAVAAAILNVSIPLELGKLVNIVAELQVGREVKDYLRHLAPSALRLLVLYSLQALSTFVYITALSIAGEWLSIRLRLSLFNSLLCQDIAFFDQHRTGELVSRLSADVQEFKSSFKLVIGQGLRSVAQVVGCAGSLLLISPHMTISMAMILPAMIAVGTVLGTILRQWSRQSQEQVAVAMGVADEALGNVRTVRSFAMEDTETEWYEAELRKSQYFATRLGVGVATFQALSHLAINGLVLLVVGQGGILLTTNQITPGSLMAFLVATQTIQRSLASLSVLSGQVVRGLSAGGRVWEYMRLQPSMPLVQGGTLSRDHLHGNVKFDNVTFTYPSRQDQEVLKGLNLELPAGKVTALCGLSGAGKSTVAALLEKFYDPDKGVVYLDGVPVKDLSGAWLRGQVIGYISQEPVLFATSVLENIRYGRVTATDQEVWEAAKLANCHNFIREFPLGYQTQLGERGQTLSGGQKQRVAIARALLKNPTILILDEATSALDAHSEQLVQEALEKACNGRTVLVIAHRLSTIRDADQIAVLHQGQLQEIGSHEDLLRRKGLYCELIRRQTSYIQ